MGGKKSGQRRKSKIAQEAALSKHRSSLLKAANELCSLDDTKAAVMFLFPDGRPLSLGHPSVIQKYLDQHPITNADMPERVQTDKEEKLHKLTKQYKELLHQLESEEQRGKMLKQMKPQNVKCSLWEVPVNKLSLNELETLDEMLEGVETSIARQHARHLSEEQGTALAENSAEAIDPFARD